MKKIVGILVIGLLIATIIPVGGASHPSTGIKDNMGYESRLFEIGLVRIDPHNYKLTGFVFFGINDGEVLVLQKIDIQFEGTIQAGGLPPFMYTIRYNPA